eukprot:3008040-Pyramimonas_sp.AAC.1
MEEEGAGALEGWGTAAVAEAAGAAAAVGAGGGGAGGTHPRAPRQPVGEWLMASVAYLLLFIDGDTFFAYNDAQHVSSVCARDGTYGMRRCDAIVFRIAGVLLLTGLVRYAGVCGAACARHGRPRGGAGAVRQLDRPPAAAPRWRARVPPPRRAAPAA